MTSVHPADDNRILNKECRTLADAGYEVVLVAPHERMEVVNGVRIRPLPGWTSRVGRTTLGMARALRAAWSERGEIYHLHDPELLLIAPILKTRARVVVYDMHENVPKALRSRDWIPPAFRSAVVSAWRLLERVLLRKVPVVFAERSYSRDYGYVGRSVIVENMVRAEVVRAPQNRNAGFTVVYVGVVGEGRGVDVLLDAAELLWNEGKQLTLECVGPVRGEALRGRLEDVKERNDGRLRLYGRLPFESAMEVVAHGHVGIALLKPYPNFVESFPTKMFEYMALGIPVIVSDFPLYRDVVETAQCGICVDPTSPRELADAIRMLHEGPEAASAMGRRGRDAAAGRYSWEAQGEKLVSFYDALLHGG